MTYLILGLVSFLQSMIFTLNSRSRASGNVTKHLFTGMLSHGMWFVCTFMLLFPEMFKAVATGSQSERWTLLAVYAITNALGGAFMMKINLGHWRVKYLTEEGKSKVGSR